MVWIGPLPGNPVGTIVEATRPCRRVAVWATFDRTPGATQRRFHSIPAVLVRLPAGKHGRGSGTVWPALEHRNRPAESEEHTRSGTTHMHHAGDGGQGTEPGHGGLQPGPRDYLPGGRAQWHTAPKLQLHARPQDHPDGHSVGRSEE